MATTADGGEYHRETPPRGTGANSLRERAELLLRGACLQSTDQVVRDALPLLQELRLHQVELELQNDQLRAVEQDLELQNDQLRTVEAALELSRAKYRDLFELAPLGYVSLDAGGVIGHANGAAAVLLGVPQGGQGRTLAEFTEGRDLRVLRAHLHAAAQGHHACEVRLQRPDASSAWALVESRPAPGGGCLTMLTDISERKRSEAALAQAHAALVERTDELGTRNDALQAALSAHAAVEAERSALATRLRDAERLESLGLVAGGIAHDFNNLLVGVMANADLLLETMPDLSETVRERLATIKRASRSAADLTRQLLVYAGRGHVKLRPVQLESTIRECLQLFQARMRQGVELRAELALEAHWINADPGQLQQVVANLVTNALEAIGENLGSVTVRTRLEQLDAPALATFPHITRAKPGPFAVLEVEDTGVGIDAAHLSRIFEPFFTSKFTGRGLGLASVRGIVHSHDAALRVRSVPGQGSRFEIAWPLASTSAVSETARSIRVPRWKRSGEVLLVDDDPAVRRALVAQLEQLGFSVTQAASGREAVELFRVQPSRFRLAVVDRTMPDLSGDQVIERLHLIAPALPVVLVSGYSAGGPVTDGDHVAFVAKPMTLSELQQAISRLIDPASAPSSSSPYPPVLTDAIGMDIAGE